MFTENKLEFLQKLKYSQEETVTDLTSQTKLSYVMENISGMQQTEESLRPPTFTIRHSYRNWLLRQQQRLMRQNFYLMLMYTVYAWFVVNLVTGQPSQLSTLNYSLLLTTLVTPLTLLVIKLAVSVSEQI